MARRIRARGIKASRAYTVEELAECLGVTEQTVRGFLKAGLPALTGQRPALILGCDVQVFLADREERKRRPLAIGEFFCLRCKVPVTAAHGLADYRALTERSGRIEAFCARCEGPCSRVVSAARLPEWRRLCTLGGNAPWAA